MPVINKHFIRHSVFYFRSDEQLIASVGKSRCCDVTANIKPHFCKKRKKKRRKEKKRRSHTSNRRAVYVIYCVLTGGMHGDFGLNAAFKRI